MGLKAQEGLYVLRFTFTLKCGYELGFLMCVCLYQENVKYAIRLRNRGQRTRNGDGGMARVKCCDGTVFTFSSCSLSSNGTNQSRGQIPVIYYYR